MPTMNFDETSNFNITSNVIKSRLELLSLTEDDVYYGRLLQQDVIQPCIPRILDKFYNTLTNTPEFNAIFAQGFKISALKVTQEAYLRSLGVNFQSSEYFQTRLKIGLIHIKVGVKPSLYQCSYRLLQQIIIDSIPTEHPNQKELLAFILKITTLDMSLAIEAYEAGVMKNLHSSVQTLTDEKTSLSEELAKDELTGVLSRRRILEILEKRLVSIQTPQPISVIMADLDYFKNINDQYGHLIGDDVLKETASRIRTAIRSSNALGRYGGEEFLIVLSDTNAKQALLVAERIRKTVNNTPINVMGQYITLTLSLGIASTQNFEPIASLIDRADKALYRAKDNGRNRVETDEST